MQEIKRDNINEIYTVLAKRFLKQGKIVGDTLELTNQIFTLNYPYHPYILNFGREVSIKYLLAENIWYAVGSEDLWFISHYAKKWKEISDTGISCNSAYGYIMKFKFNFNQIEKIIELLEKDKNSRRACIIINDANENVIETKDEQCTMYIQLSIRNGKLNMTVCMRSNDFIYGLPNDIVAFCGLQLYIASRLKLSPGTYTHFANSLHLYKSDNLKLELISKGLYRDADFNINFIKLYNNANKIYDLVKQDPDNIVEICKKEGILYDI